MCRSVMQAQDDYLDAFASPEVLGKAARPLWTGAVRPSPVRPDVEGKEGRSDGAALPSTRQDPAALAPVVGPLRGLNWCSEAPGEDG